MKKYTSNLFIFALMLLFCSYNITPVITNKGSSSCATFKNTKDTRLTSSDSLQKVIFVVRDDDIRIRPLLTNILFYFNTSCRLILIEVKATLQEELYAQNHILLDRSYTFHLLSVLKSRAHPPTF